MWNAGLNEVQTGIKIARRNISNFKYAEDTILKAESEEELNVKEKSKKADLKLNIEKRKIMASSPTTSWQIEGEKVQAVTDFIFLDFQNHCRQWLQPWN